MNIENSNQRYLNEIENLTDQEIINREKIFRNNITIMKKPAKIGATA